MLFLLHLKFTSLTLLSNLNLIITISLSDFETVPVQGASDVAQMWPGCGAGKLGGTGILAVVETIFFLFL